MRIASQKIRNRCIFAGTNCIRRDGLAGREPIRIKKCMSDLFHDRAGKFSRGAWLRNSRTRWNGVNDS